MRARTGWWLLAVVACTSGDPASAPAPASNTTSATSIDVPVRVDGRPAPALVVAAAPVDLFAQCARSPHATIIARAARGTYVQGLCDQRATYALTLDNLGGIATVRLWSASEGARTVVARADHVVAIELVVAPAPDSALRAGLTIIVPGRPDTALSGDEIDALTPTQQHQAGVPLAALLAAAKIHVPTGAHLTVVAQDERIEVDAAWLRDPAHQVRLKHNRQGLLRFDHVDPKGVSTHLRDVRTIAITPAKT